MTNAAIYAAIFVGLESGELEDELYSITKNFVLKNKEQVIKELDFYNESDFIINEEQEKKLGYEFYYLKMRRQDYGEEYADVLCKHYLDYDEDDYELKLDKIGRSSGIDGLTSFFDADTDDHHIGFIVRTDGDITDDIVNFPEMIKKAKEKFKKAFERDARIYLLATCAWKLRQQDYI